MGKSHVTKWRMAQARNSEWQWNFWQGNAGTRRITCQLIGYQGCAALCVGLNNHQLELTPSRAHFELADKESPMSFDGRMTNGVMTGVVDDSGMKLPFRLDLAARIGPFPIHGRLSSRSGTFDQHNSNLAAPLAGCF
jgi:hypothetical protein